MEYPTTNGSEAGGGSSSPTKKEKEVFDLAMLRHTESENFEEDERELCVEDSLFCDRPGSQWDEIGRRGRVRAKRPMYEINKVAGARNQFVGDQLQNRIEIKILPKGGGATKALARIQEGLIRSIRDSSGTSWKDNGLKETSTGGVGAWQVCTRQKLGSFDQEIYLKPIRGAATTVWVDPGSIMDVHEDAKWISCVHQWTPLEFKDKWPESKAANFRLIGINGCKSGWRTQDMVRVADYYVKEPIKRDLVLMSNGKVYEDDDNFKKIDDDLAEKEITVVDRRTEDSHKILHYKLSGSEILDGPNDIPGMHLPIILGYGYSTWIEGIHYYSGMVRKSKDPQRVYNYETSSNVETGALAPKDPYWISTVQAKGYEGDYARLNTENKPVQFFNPDPQNPGPPKRTGAPAVQAAQIQRIQQAEHDIESTTGYFAPSLGNNPKAQSGVALDSQKRQGFTGTAEISDNHRKMLEQTGKVIQGMLPAIYDGSRTEQIIHENGEIEEVKLNDVVIDQDTDEEIVLNDLSAGVYASKVTVGPTFATKKEEAIAYLAEAGRSNPMIPQLTTDIILRNMDFPGSDEASDRFRKLGLKEGYIPPNKEEQAEQAEADKNRQPDPMEILAFETMKAELEKKVAEVDKMDLENDQIRALTAKTWAETQETLANEDIRTVEGMAAAKNAVFQVEKTILDAKIAEAKEAREAAQPAAAPAQQ